MASVPALIVIWCFVVGACIGSFLNVVAWRLPQRLSLSWPGSLCPACRTPILFRDNIPVLGWILLRGRCRACRAPISIRYPTVEFLTACAFAALGYAELVNLGDNLPTAAIGTTGMLAGTWVYHATLMALLIVNALFTIDAARPPRTFIALTIALGIVPPLITPWLYPVPFAGAAGLISAADAVDLGGTAQPFTGVAGLLCGGILGAMLEWGASGGQWRCHNGTGVLALAAAGAFLGWQTVISVAAIVALYLAGSSLASLRARPPASSPPRRKPSPDAIPARHEMLVCGPAPALPAPAAALATILGWSQLATLGWWAGPYAPVARLFAVVVGIAAASLVLAAIARFRSVIVVDWFTRRS